MVEVQSIGACFMGSLHDLGVSSRAGFQVMSLFLLFSSMSMKRKVKMRDEGESKFHELLLGSLCHLRYV